jgi:hypothetical protein
MREITFFKKILPIMTHGPITPTEGGFTREKAEPLVNPASSIQERLV